MKRCASYCGMSFESKEYQFVSYFPKWCGINVEHFNPKKTDYAYIYEWIVRLGFWHIRKWSTLNIEEEETWHYVEVNLDRGLDTFEYRIDGSEWKEQIT